MEVDLDKDGKGALYIDEGGKRIAEMLIGINGKTLIVFNCHGQWKKLLHELMKYAQKHQLKVMQHCVYQPLKD
ncbi:hypothetical protein [Chitinophaga sp.]|uniref:hypothetical protein n=1 Tax=Chitinophaga sp. TaxID=1869181 RepID=UPI0031E2EBC6